jgi:hypothetical protein
MSNWKDEVQRLRHELRDSAFASMAVVIGTASVALFAAALFSIASK